MEDCALLVKGVGYDTSVFFSLILRWKFLAVAEKWLTMHGRASSVWVRRAQ